jgi:hypothetical protein
MVIGDVSVIGDIARDFAAPIANTITNHQSHIADESPIQNHHSPMAFIPSSC